MKTNESLLIVARVPGAVRTRVTRIRVTPGAAVVLLQIRIRVTGSDFASIRVGVSRIAVVVVGAVIGGGPPVTLNIRPVASEILLHIGLSRR